MDPRNQDQQQLGPPHIQFQQLREQQQQQQLPLSFHQQPSLHQQQQLHPAEYINDEHEPVRGPPHEMDDMVRFAWSNYRRARRKLYLFELRLCSRALDYLQSEIELLHIEERPIMLWFRRVELSGEDIEQALRSFLMKRPELLTVTLIGWTRHLGEGASVIDDYVPILKCLDVTDASETDSSQYPHHISTIEVEQMRLTRQDMGTLLGGACMLRKIKFSRSTLDAGFLSGFCTTRTCPRTLKMVQCFANSNSTLEAMALNAWQEQNQMHELDLQNNRLTAASLASIAELLSQQQSSLQTLRLGSNFELLQPHPQPECWKLFVTALSQTERLKTVYLESCKMNVQMATELLHAVRNSCQVLNLQGTNLFDDDDVALCASIQSEGDSRSISRRQKLSGTTSDGRISSPTHASSAFFHCLATNGCSLVDMVLSGCNIGNPCAKLLFAALEHNRTLQSLDLRDNPMTVHEGTWELSLPRLSPELSQLWFPLTNFLPTMSNMHGLGADSWSIFETALLKNLYLTKILEPNMSRALPGRQRVTLGQFELRNQGLLRARLALQNYRSGVHVLLWPRIVARLWHGWEGDQNSSAVYTFVRRSAEGEEWQTIAGSNRGRKRAPWTRQED